MGLYLGPSPNREISVSLILHLETPMGLPQFHILHNVLFGTVIPTAYSLSTLYLCQHLSLFTRDWPHHVQTQEIGSVPEPVIPDQSHQELLPHG